MRSDRNPSSGLAAARNGDIVCLSQQARSPGAPLYPTPLYLLRVRLRQRGDCRNPARTSPGIVFTKSIQYLAHLMRERQTMGVLHHREVIAGHLDDLQAATE